jgi:hypothetical protein
MSKEKQLEFCTNQHTTYWRGLVDVSCLLINDVFFGIVNIQQERTVISSIKPAEERIELSR